MPPLISIFGKKVGRGMTKCIKKKKVGGGHGPRGHDPVEYNNFFNFKIKLGGSMTKCLKKKS